MLVHSILQRHITSTLQSWQLWTKEGGTTESQGAGEGGATETRGADEGGATESRGAGEGGATESRGAGEGGAGQCSVILTILFSPVSLQLMCKWLLSAGDTQLAQEVPLPTLC